MIHFIAVPLKGRNKLFVKILADRQHRTTPAGPVLGGGVATPTTPAALTPMPRRHATNRLLDRSIEEQGSTTHGGYISVQTLRRR